MLQKDPPLESRMVDIRGMVTPVWRLWFQSLQQFDNRISVLPEEVFTDDARLTTKDFGSVIKFDNGDNPVVCYLPSVALADIGGFFTITKLGAGALRVRAADLDTIGKSSPGGAIVSVDARPGANVKLSLDAETVWTITGGLGVWYVV